MLKKIKYLLFIQNVKHPNKKEVNTTDKVGTIPIDKKTMNETITLPKEILSTSVSNVKEEAKNNFEAIITPIQVQYSNIDTDEEERSINIANLEIDGAKFR